MIARLILFFVICFLSMVRVCPGSEGTDNATRKAEDIFRTFKNTASSARVIKQRYVNPLLSNIPLYTIDSSESFNIQILCPSAKEFMTILAQPQSTGDINVKVFLDRDRNGMMDGEFTFNGISGVCANGFIRCEPGTWNSCKFYTFEYDGSVLKEKEVSFKELGGCFCINNSCGRDLAWRNMYYILSVLGGAIVQEFQRVDPSFTMSSSVLEGTALKFYAQSLSNCFATGGSSRVRELGNYLENPYTMQSDASSLYLTEVENPESPTYLVEKAAGNMNEFVEERTCTIRRVITTRRYDLTELFSSAKDCRGGIPGPYSCGEKCVYFEIGVHQEYGGSGYSKVEFEMTPDFYEIISEIKGHWRTDTTGPYPCFDDDGYVKFYLNGNYAGGQSYGDSEAECGCCAAAPHHWVTLNKNLLIPPPSSSESVINTLEIRAGGMGGGEGVTAGCRPVQIYFYLSKPFKGCYITGDYVENGCESLENDSQCVLWEEKVDGVLTVKEGMRTGFYPLTKCETFCDKVICGTHWLVERKYKCKEGGASLSDAEKRLEKVYTTSTFNPSAGVITYTDIRKEDDIWSVYPSLEVNVADSFNRESGECEYICKVEVSSIGKDVRVNMNLSDDSRKVFVYRPCDLNAEGTYVCPVNPGERIAEDCSCHSFFAEATIVLQAMRLAGSDFICSSGVEKAF